MRNKMIRVKNPLPCNYPLSQLERSEATKVEPGPKGTDNSLVKTLMLVGWAKNF